MHISHLYKGVLPAIAPEKEEGEPDPSLSFFALEYFSDLFLVNLRAYNQNYYESINSSQKNCIIFKKQEISITNRLKFTHLLSRVYP